MINSVPAYVDSTTFYNHPRLGTYQRNNSYKDQNEMVQEMIVPDRREK